MSSDQKKFQQAAATRVFFLQLRQFKDNMIEIEVLWEGHKIWKKIFRLFEKILSKQVGWFFLIFVALSEYLNFRKVYSWYYWTQSYLRKESKHVTRWFFLIFVALSEYLNFRKVVSRCYWTQSWDRNLEM